MTELSAAYQLSSVEATPTIPGTQAAPTGTKHCLPQCMETPDPPVVVRTILSTEQSPPGSMDLQWLVETTTNGQSRRRDERFRKLSRIVTAVRKDLQIPRRKHPDFWPAVKRSIELFTLACKECPLSFDVAAQRDGVARIMQFNIKNHNGRENMKKRRIQSLPDNETTTADLVSATEDAENCGSSIPDKDPNMGKHLVSFDASAMPAREGFNIGDIVAVMNKRTVMGMADIVQPLVERNDGSYDFTKCTIRVLAQFTNQHQLERGSYVIVQTGCLALIPGSRLNLFKELSRFKGKCQRGEDCKLSHDTMVLLDLDDEFLGYWPLVAKVKSIGTTNKGQTEFTIVWYEGCPDKGAVGPLMDAKWLVYKRAGKVQEGSYATSAHYYCGFQLTEANELPNDAKDATREHVENCSHFE